MTRTLLATVWVVLLPVAAVLQAQSLAGVAKKAEEESTKAKQEQSAEVRSWPTNLRPKGLHGQRPARCAARSGCFISIRDGRGQQQLEDDLRRADSDNEGRKLVAVARRHASPHVGRRSDQAGSRQSAL
jgi:hypothetical protein